MRKRARELLLYLDDSGSRDPDRTRTSGSGEPDWFGLGGVLVDVSDKADIEAMVADLHRRWPQMQAASLRSYDIRNKTKAFRWLADCSQGQVDQFMEELEHLMLSAPMLATGCIVHRPGYNERYLWAYGPRRWKLCRTAFNIVVERAAKYAIHCNARLRVFVERCDSPTERQMKAYFDEMRNVGLPFSATTSAVYSPLTQQQLHAALLEFGVKTKQSVLMQLADIALWPLCKGGYDQTYRPFAAMAAAGKLLDSVCTPANGLYGIKYSCFPST
jgi:hypothetical protein